MSARPPMRPSSVQLQHGEITTERWRRVEHTSCHLESAFQMFELPPACSSADLGAGLVWCIVIAAFASCSTSLALTPPACLSARPPTRPPSRLLVRLPTRCCSLPTWPKPKATMQVDQSPKYPAWLMNACNDSILLHTSLPTCTPMVLPATHHYAELIWSSFRTYQSAVACCTVLRIRMTYTLYVIDCMPGTNVTAASWLCIPSLGGGLFGKKSVWFGSVVHQVRFLFR